ncbi:MAG TPA: C40 family peptidase [Gaiellaceae bacterium]|nr:C40 family peptidase [Gaiellaceae bacterium]
MTDRIRFALLFLVLLAFGVARVSGALAATKHVARATRATTIAREQQRIVTFARRYIGVPYSYGGTSPRSGFDCSGFTRFVYAHFGISLPHYSGAQFDLGHRVLRGRLRPGDLVFFDGLGHVGIYVGHGDFIHAPHTGTRVQITPLAGWYSSLFDGARRIV